MAKVVVTASHDWRKICELAGGNPKLIIHYPKTDELEVTDVTQAALDKALADYVADQVNIDAATAAAKRNPDRENAHAKLKSVVGLTDAEIAAL